MALPNNLTNGTTADADEVMANFNYLEAAIMALNPVGTIREFNVSTNPATLLGFGTWAAFGTGRVTVAIDTGQAEFDTNGEIGGAKTVSIAHTHAAGSLATGYDAPQTTAGSGTGTTIADNNHTHSITGSTAAMSANDTPSVLQPYIVVYRWVRTA